MFSSIQRHHIPNILTLSRIVTIPLMVVLFFVPKAWAAWTILAIYAPAAITDYLDGYLARSLSITSPVGKFLDPIADKLFVGALLFMLAAVNRLDGPWALPALIILLREIFIAGLREYLGPMNIQIPVSNLAKWKTGVQMGAIGFLIVGPYAPEWIPSLIIGKIGLLMAMILAIRTGWDYAKTAMPYVMR
jgi:cardiolipin synthase